MMNTYGDTTRWSNYTITNTDLWNVVANSTKLYQQHVIENIRSLAILSWMFKYSDTVKKYNLKFGDCKLAQNRSTDSMYSLGTTSLSSSYNSISRDTTCMCVIKGFANEDKQVTINMNGCTGYWEFVIQLQNNTGLAEKLYQGNIINPTFTTLLDALDSGIKTLTSE